MAQKKIKRLTAPRSFVSDPSGDPSASNATAVAFIAETVAGIEWELDQLNDRLSEIIGVLGRERTSRR